MQGWAVRPRAERLRGLPLLLLSGTSDTVVFEEYAALAAGLPQCEVGILGDSGHAPFYEKAHQEEYFRALGRFFGAPPPSAAG